MLDTRRSTWSTLRRQLTRRRPRPTTESRPWAPVVPLRTVVATTATDSARPPRPAPRVAPLAALNPSDSLSRMLPH